MRLTMPRPIPVLQTELITLRAPDPELDAPDYYEINRDPEMHRWTGNRVLLTVEEARNELEAYVGMDDVTTWLVEDNSTNRVIGRFFITLEDRDGVATVGEGNRIARSHWRKGYNRAARKLIFEYVFGERGAERIETAAWEGNVNSIKSIEAHGFRFERDEREWNGKQGKHLLMKYYSMTRSEWLVNSQAR